MGHGLNGVFGISFLSFVGVMWAALGAAMFLLPFALLSMTRNIKQIRVQLERLNDTLEARGRSGAGGVLGI